MKVLYLADIHFVLKYLDVLINAFNKTMIFALENGYQNIVIAGDVFDNRQAVPTRVRVAVENLFYRWAGEGLNFFIMPGNHDMPSYGARDINALNGLKRIENVNIFDYPSAGKVGSETFCFIPYNHNLEDFKQEFCSLVENYHPHTVVIHQGVDEAKSAGMPDSGLNTNFFSEVFDGFVVAGDFHKSILVDKFLSPGCTIQDDFGDVNQAKGFWTFDGEFKFHKADYPEFIKIELESMSDIRGRSFENCHMWFKTTKKALKRKLEERCLKDGALSCRVSVEKTFATSHEKTIEIGSDSEMIEQMIEIRKPENALLQKEMFHRIIILKETFADTIADGFSVQTFLNDEAVLEQLSGLDLSKSIPLDEALLEMADELTKGIDVKSDIDDW